MKTWKIFYFIFMAVMGCQPVLAQNGMVSWGIKGGLNEPQLRGSDVSKTFNSPQADFSNFMIGLSANSKTGKYFWLKHDILYSKKFMTTQMSDIVNGTFSSVFKRHYIDIYPISPAFHFKGFQLFAGPYLGILLNASVQRKDINGRLYDDSIFGNPTQNSSYAQKFDYGYVVGMEYEFKFGINVGVRYTKGFVPVIENAAQQTQFSVYNSFASLTIGYNISEALKKREKKAK